MLAQFAWICTDGGCADITLLYFVLLPLLIITALSVSIYGAAYLLRRNENTRAKPTHELKRFMLIFFITLGMAIFSVLLFVGLPSMLTDKKWQNKQEACAKEVGYSSPAADNSSLATSDSQRAYRACLDR
ncbi:MAG: hypothetical protein QG629_691 [Patescibacteria group bacterium]|nr:hypothetical protein [Candidatus Saccharibacteria bacterium]MDQ5963608.1 hypothetical protein [Patescibacteria group bacterium]